MNNAILFFYNINVSNVKKINKNYYFQYLNNNYGIYSYNRDISDAEVLYSLNLELLNRGLVGYQIILTKNKEVLFIYEDNYYIMMKLPNIKNRIINYNDILYFNFEITSNAYQKLDKSNWNISWSNKIDFIEYQFKQMNNKYPILNDVIDYFIGIWENAISYYTNNVNFKHLKYVCHKRISIDMDLYDFLNPLNFVIDYKERDIGDYLKSYIIKKNYSLNSFSYIFNNLSRESMILLISRILFPSYFFDLYEKIIIDNYKESEIIEIIKKRNNTISLIKYIFDNFSNYNIPYIDWIKKSD